MPPRSLVPGYEQIVVSIEDVDIPNRLCHCFDKTNGRIQVSWRDIPGGGLLRIPLQGETWTAVRQGFVWRLVGRLASLQEQQNIETQASPGDTSIYSPAGSAVRIHTPNFVVSGRSVGGTVVQTYTSDTGFSSIVLNSSPIPPSIQIFVNGLLIPPTSWSFDGTGTITFTSTFGSGLGSECVVYYQSLSSTDTVL